MGLSRTISETEISFENHIFPPLVFAPPLKGFPWSWIWALGVRKLEWWRYRADKRVWRYLQPSGYNPPMWQTDTGQQQRPRLRNMHIVAR